MPFYIYAWLGSIGSGLFTITAKLTAKHSIANPWLFNFLLTFITLLFTLPVCLVNHATLPHQWLPIILASFFATLFNIFWVFATYKLDITTLAPLFNFRGIFAVFLGTIFFKETFNSSQIIYIVIILLAGIFASMDEKLSIRSFFKGSIAIGIASVLFLAVYNAFVKLALQTDSLWSVNVWIAILMMVMILPTYPLFSKNLMKLDKNHFLPVVIMGIFSTFTDFVARKAYGVNVSISSLIMNTPFSMIIAFVLSFFAPKLLEKHSIKIYVIRFTAVTVMILSAIQLSR